MKKTIATIRDGITPYQLQVKLKSNSQLIEKEAIKNELELELNAYKRAIERILRLKKAVDDDKYTVREV